MKCIQKDCIFSSHNKHKTNDILMIVLMTIIQSYYITEVYFFSEYILEHVILPTRKLILNVIKLQKKTENYRTINKRNTTDFNHLKWLHIQFWRCILCTSSTFICITGCSSKYSSNRSTTLELLSVIVAYNWSVEEIVLRTRHKQKWSLSRKLDK